MGRHLVLSSPNRAGIAQLVERHLAKVEVASSSLVSRSNASHSSSGLGHRPFTAVTGVRTPYGTPLFRFRLLSGNSSVGRAPPCQGGGREFEPRFPLHASHSSSGLGHRPFTAVTGVRTPYGTPLLLYLRCSRGNSSVGRAPPCQGGGREFEPRFPLQSVFCRRLMT